MKKGSFATLRMMGIAMIVLLSGCKSRVSSDLRNLSATADFLDAVIPDAVIQVEASDATDNDAVMDQIRMQLKYFFVGQLKGRSAGSDFNRAQITIISRTGSDQDAAVSDGKLIEIHYSARFTVAWPKGTEFPKIFSVIMPGTVKGTGFTKFTETFSENCNDGEETDISNPWHYRPEESKCPLAPLASGPGTAYGILNMSTIPVSRSRIAAVLQPAKPDKNPEYDRVWRDGQMNALLIYAKDSPGSNSPDDVGSAEFNRTYANLMTAFGKSTNGAKIYGDGKGPFPEKNSAELIFGNIGTDGTKTMKVKIILVDSIEGIANPEVIASASRDAEFIYYGGHSGYGRNIRGLVQLLEYPAGLYRLYFLDGCNSFDYMNAALNEKVKAANPGSPASKYADVMSNALPAPFDDAPPSVKILSAFAGSNTSYRQILADVDADTLSVVEGEEDNGARFP